MVDGELSDALAERLDRTERAVSVITRVDGEMRAVGSSSNWTPACRPERAVSAMTRVDGEMRAVESSGNRTSRDHVSRDQVRHPGAGG